MDLVEKLDRINKLFDIERVLNRPADREHIARYYRVNRLAYALFHSPQGFVHMGISKDGMLHTSDLLESANYVAKHIESRLAMSVLELAYGKGANTTYLATRFPNVQFFGIDLPGGQATVVHRDNVNLSLGDYHDLSRYAPESFDIVFVIEALCHSNNKESVLCEVKRILKKGGLLIVIDGYRRAPEGTVTPEQKVAMKLIEKGMMVERFVEYDSFRNILQSENFQVLEEEDVSIYIIPTTERFERKAKLLIEHPAIAGIIIALFPYEFTANAISGYLMPNLFRDRLFCYTMLTAVRV